MVSESVPNSLPSPLPTDPETLKSLLITSHELSTSRFHEIQTLQTELSSIQASHSNLVTKSSKWEDELQSLKTKIPVLEREIKSERSKREEEENRVKDLRLTSEESRRAIMRLQVEIKESKVKVQQDKEKEKEKLNHRRSLGPGALAGWNPPNSNRETEESAAEARELKKSKRASLAFGPNAGVVGGSGFINPRSSVGGASSIGGHRRTASGSVNNRSSVIYNNDSGSESEMANNCSSTIGRSTGGGLRGLRLSGAPSMQSSNKEDSSSIDQASRRDSTASTNSAISPRSANSDLPASNEVASDGIALTEAALNRSTTLSSRIRNGSNGPRRSQSNGEVMEGLPSITSGLSVPGTSSSTLGILNGFGRGGNLSASPTPSQSALSSMGSPIMEESPSQDYVDEFETSSQFARSTQDSEFEEGPKTATLLNTSTASNNNYSNLRNQAQLKSKEAEIERLRLEMSQLRKQLEEAKEGRMASETCLKVLREFISGHDEQQSSKGTDGEGPESPGIQLLKNMKLPPLPTDKETTANGNKNSNPTGIERKETAGWGIKLPAFIGKKLEGSDAESGSEVNGSNDSSVDKRTSISATPNANVASSTLGNLGNLWNRNSQILSSPQISRNQQRDSNLSELPSSLNSPPLTHSNETSQDTPTTNTFGKGLGSWFTKKPNSELSTSPTKSMHSQDGLTSPTSLKPSLPPRKSSTFSASSQSKEDEGLKDHPAFRLDEDKGLGIGMNGKGKDIQPNERARKAMSRTVSVEEDGGFVPPSFD